MVCDDVVVFGLGGCLVFGGLCWDASLASASRVYGLHGFRFGMGSLGFDLLCNSGLLVWLLGGGLWSVWWFGLWILFSRFGVRVRW